MTLGCKRIVAVALAVGLMAFAAPALGKKHHHPSPASFPVSLDLSYDGSTGDFTATADSPKRACEIMRSLILWNYPYGGGPPSQVGSAITDDSGSAVFEGDPAHPFLAGIYTVSADREKLHKNHKPLICRPGHSHRERY
jgi:hypothetical protein